MRKTCELCDGVGRLVEANASHLDLSQLRGARRRAATRATPLALDRGLGYLLIVALIAYVSFVLSNDPSRTFGWSKVAVALMATTLLLFILNHFCSAPRALRWCTLLLFTTVVCGGFLLEITRY